MPQVTRALKRAFLLMMPSGMRNAYLHSHPNIRKAAPPGMRFIFDHYLGRFSVHIDTQFKVERVMWTGRFEEGLVELIQKRVRPGDVCFDIGGNVGAVTLPLADAVGPAGSVHTFEPEPRNFVRLSNNLALNPSIQRQVTLNQLGLSDEAGALYWSEDPGNPGNGTLGATGEQEIRVTTLDAYCEEMSVARIDFMKVDVEGMELQVFRGGEKSLRTFRPAIYFETLGRYKGAAKSNFDHLESFLKDCGYTLHKLHRDGSLTPSSIRNTGSYTVAIGS